MPLSEYERRVLDQMERQLLDEDPKFATSLERHAPRGVGRWLLVALGVLVGLGVLVVGAVIGQTVVGVLGFVVMFVAVAAGLTPRRQGAAAAPARTPSRPTGGFMKNVEDRWDRRREAGR